MWWYVLTRGMVVLVASVDNSHQHYSEKQNTATATVCTATHMDIHPPRGKTGASWEHTNTRSVNKGPYIQGHSGLCSSVLLFFCLVSRETRQKNRTHEHQNRSNRPPQHRTTHQEKNTSTTTDPQRRPTNQQHKKSQRVQKIKSH